jgi:hypothetical protein
VLQVSNPALVDGLGGVTTTTGGASRGAAGVCAKDGAVQSSDEIVNSLDASFNIVIPIPIRAVNYVAVSRIKVCARSI